MVTEALGLGLEVGAPPATPPLHGLRDSAREIAATDPRWELGFRFQPESCGDVKAASELCDALGTPFDDPDDIPAEQQNLPYVLYVPFMCDMQGQDLRDDRGRATRVLEAGTSKGMELQFWGDPLGTGNFSLVESTPATAGDAQTGASGVVGEGLSPRRGLARLGQALAKCGVGSRGMIHATVELASLWTVDGMLEVVGPRLETPVRGDIVVAGSGYDGSGPSGHVAAAPTADLVWAYATGMVEYRLTEPRFEATALTEVVNRPQNEIEWHAQRTVGAAPDGCCAFAVLVDMTL